VEGVLSGEKGSWDCPINLKIFGPGEPVARAQLEAKLKSDRVPIKKLGIAAPKAPKNAVPPPQRRQMGYHSSQSSSQPSSSQPEPLPELGIEHFIQHSERFNPRDVEKLVEEWGAAEDALKSMPMAEQPLDLISTLLPYQRQGLAWLLEKERPALPAVGSTDVVQLWKRSAERSNAFTNIATQYSTATPPVLAKGGILADDMGLGKTLQVISLILEGSPGTTLIVAPVSVMSNWVQQIERHVKKGKNMKVLTYHGGNRKRMTHREFAEYDVVVTSYGTLSTEYSTKDRAVEKIPRRDGLFSTHWARVVLDEFIGITGGLERMEIFNAVLTRPLALGDPSAEAILQSVMRTWCLRRKKDMKFVDLKLPELSEYVHRITFRKDEREKYDAFQ
jgi:SWI/SNF-related matrix-associated actin-dependent regulator of chromatin subfamily A3